MTAPAMPCSNSSLLIPFACVLLAGCGSNDSPVQANLGTDAIATSVGPGGATVRGTGALAGLLIEIPPGALRQLVKLEIAVGEEFVLPGTVAAAEALRITAVPDPGALLLPFKISMEIAFPVTRDPADLLVAGQVSVPTFDGRAATRLGLAAELGTYDESRRRFTAEIGRFASLQIRYTAAERLIDDANALVGLALDSFDRLTDESLLAADLQLASALKADPFFPAARVLRAISRVLVVVNDRQQRGPGLQSVGDAAVETGLDVQRRSLLRRLIDADWPRRLIVPRSAPQAADVLEMLQAQLRPALEQGLLDLAFVPPHTELAIALPSALTALPGTRQIDAADLSFLRSLFAFGLYSIDALEDVVLTVDPAFWSSPAAATATPEDLLARFPEVGKRLVPPSSLTQDHLVEAMSLLVEGYRQLNQESDGQGDDLVVFSSSFGAEKRDRWQNSLQQGFESLVQEGPRSLLVDRYGVINLDLAALRAGIDARSLTPALFGFAPLAGTLPDPSLGGLLPTRTQDGAARLFHLPNRFALPTAAIVIDGDPSDWPATAEALLPEDAAGDSGKMSGLDLGQVFLARSGDDLLYRLSLVRGAFEFRDDRTAIYGFRIRSQRRRPAAGGPGLLFTVEMTSAGPEVTVRRDGQLIAVRHAVAVAGAHLELAFNRFDLFEPDEPVRDRTVRAFSSGFDSSGAAHRGDRTRAILTRF